MSRAVAGSVATVTVLVLAALAGWVVWDRTHPSYCEVVADRQAGLTELRAEDDPEAAFRALDAYRDLRDAAPDDVRDEWDLVVSRLEELEKAVDEDEQDRVEAAAQALGDPTTATAMADLEQQALDVCHTPLAR